MKWLKAYLDNYDKTKRLTIIEVPLTQSLRLNNCFYALLAITADGMLINRPSTIKKAKLTTRKEEIFHVDARDASHQSLKINNEQIEAHRVRFQKEGDDDELEGGAEVQERAEEEEKVRAREMFGIRPLLGLPLQDLQ